MTIIQSKIKISNMTNKSIAEELIKISKKYGKCAICGKSVKDMSKHIIKHSLSDRIHALADCY